MGLADLWTRFVDDFRELWRWVRGESQPDITLAEMLKATLPRIPEPAIDWFVWECEQYAKSPVFWHDHWRYEGTEWAYPEPTEPQRRKVWNASLQRAIDRHGEANVRAQGHYLAGVMDAMKAHGDTSLSDAYWRQPDPWGWAMSQRVH